MQYDYQYTLSSQNVKKQAQAFDIKGNMGEVDKYV